MRIKLNAIKYSTRITKCGSSFLKILEATAKLLSNINTSEDPSNPLLQVLLSISIDTIKETFYHIYSNIIELYGQNKCTVTAMIVQKWEKIILGGIVCI